MSALAGHEMKVYAQQLADSAADPTTVASYTEICGIDTIDIGETRIALNKTDFQNTEGVMKRFQGLRDGTISMSGFYHFNSTDAGQQEIYTAYTGDADDVVWIMWAFTGTPADGTEHVKCVVDEFRRSASVDGRVDLNISLSMTGAVASGPTS